MAGSRHHLCDPSDEALQLQSLFPHSQTTTSLTKPEDRQNCSIDQNALENECQGHLEQNSDRNQDHEDEYNSLSNSSRPGGILIQNIPNHLNALRFGDADGEKIRTEPLRGPVYLNWIVEIAMLLLSAGLLVAICLILDKYNEQEVPDWKDSGITLNALIATLATIVRAILACIVFEILAQLKWNWISNGFRPMQEFQLFDSASRGIYGTLRLLPVITFHQPIAIGAILVAVFSLGIGPFVQQTMQPYQCLRRTESSGQSATIRAANTINAAVLERYYGRSNDNLYPGIGLKTAMQDSLVNPSTDSNIPSLFTCTSGNCTFPTFSDRSEQIKDEVTHASVGICSRCVDAYDFVQGPKFIKGDFEYQTKVQFELPVYGDLEHTKNETQKIALGSRDDQHYLDLRTIPNLTWAGRVASDDFLNRARWSIANFSILAASRDHCDRLPGGNFSCPGCKNGASNEICNLARGWIWGDPPATSLSLDYVAAGCILYPCIKYYSAKVENGTLSERTVRDVPLRPQPLTPDDPYVMSPNSDEPPRWKGVQQPCYVNGTIYTSSNISRPNLDSNSTATVQFHAEDWANLSPDSRADYINITAPLECIFELPSGLVQSIRTELGRTFNVSCSIPRLAEQLECGDVE